MGFVALIIVGLAIAFWFVHQNNVQLEANEVLSKVTTPIGPSRTQPGPEAFLKVAADYSGTDAGQRAQLLGASALFTAGKYDEARAQFQRFLQEHGDSPFAGEAALGVASCAEAQGKTDDAIAAYRNVIDHYQSWNVVPLARSAMARLLEAQGKFREARSQLEEIVRNYPGSINSDAQRRLENLLVTHPELTATNLPPMNVSTPARISAPTISAPGTAPTSAPKISAPGTLTNLAPRNP